MHVVLGLEGILAFVKRHEAATYFIPKFQPMQLFRSYLGSLYRLILNQVSQLAWKLYDLPPIPPLSLPYPSPPVHPQPPPGRRSARHLLTETETVTSFTAWCSGAAAVIQGHPGAIV